MKLKQISFFVAEFSLYADIRITNKGYRRLTYGHHQFGEVSRLAKDIVIWRCTANGLKDVLGKRKRCNFRIRTKIVNGYEMLSRISVAQAHEHDH